MIDDLVIEPIAMDLLTCLKAEVKKISAPPAKVGFRTGNEVGLLIALDEDECCDGLAWVRWSGAFPSTELGVPREAPPVGGRLDMGFWSIGFELGIARCSPRGMSVRANPTAKQWDDVSLLVFEDQAALRATYCCFNNLPRRKGHTLITDAGPLDTEGGCTGSIMSLFVRGPSCEC